MKKEQETEQEEREPLLQLPSSNDAANGVPCWRLDVLPCIPTRYVIVGITFLGFVNVYALRINLSMAIVAMVNKSADSSSHLVCGEIE